MKIMTTTRFILCFWLISSISLIFAQDDEIKLNDDTGTAIQSRPAVAMTDDGYAVICWRDERTGKSQIFAQIIGNKGYKFKNNFPIEPLEVQSIQIYYQVAMANDGHFVVVWTAYSLTSTENVFARIYLANGTPLSGIIKVNDQNEDEIHTIPDVAMDREGNFVVTWSHVNNSYTSAAVLARLFDRDGKPRNASFRVDNSTTMLQNYARVGMTPEGYFTICWLNQEAGFNKVFFRNFDHLGRALTSVKRISQHEGQVADIRPPDLDIYVHDNKDMAICWAYGKTTDWKDIFARFYETSKDAWSDQIQVTPLNWGGKNVVPVIAGTQLHNNNIYFIAWETNKNGTTDIYHQGHLFNGTAHFSPPACVHLEQDAEQFGVALALSANIRVGIYAWTDNKNGNNDIYARLSGTDHLSNAIAASGFNKIVPISWDHPYRMQDLTKYIIRRSNSKTGPFTTVAEIDLSDRGLLGTQLRDWVDHDVQNDVTYYYIVRANYLGPLTGSTSDTLSATPAATMPAIISPFASIKPTLDGQIISSEWRDALVIRGNHYFMAYPVMTYIKNENNYLYLALDAQADPILDAGNTIQLVIDKDNNKKWGATAAAGNEGVITITPAQVTFTKIWGEYPNNLGAELPKAAEGVYAKISTEKGHVQYEIALDLLSSPLNIAPGQTFGLALFLDDPGYFSPLWL